MIRRPPRSTRTDTRFPYTTLFRAVRRPGSQGQISAFPDPDGTDGQLLPDRSRLGVGCGQPQNQSGEGRGRLYRHRRAEEHTSELQSLMRISYAVFCLKTKKTQHTTATNTTDKTTVCTHAKAR